MTDESVEVVAPSRLHFGLLSFNDPESPLQYGGLGVMIDAPGLRLRANRGGVAVRVDGPRRAEGFAARVLESLGESQMGCRLSVEAPRQHVGLGVGTQLGMAVAAALFELAGRTAANAGELAVASGRGLRSAIGAHGFVRGGLILDGGQAGSGGLGTLEQRVPLPEAWRFVLIVPPAESGLANAAEQAAFAALPPPPPATTQRLYELAKQQLTPAAHQSEFGRFSENLYEYGRLAGECFAAVQGGPFAGQAVAERVAYVRSLGCAGCGQSSWGPTVYAAVASHAEAEQLVGNLRGAEVAQGCDLIVARPCNEGATVRRPKSVRRR